MSNDLIYYIGPYIDLTMELHEHDIEAIECEKGHSQKCPGAYCSKCGSKTKTVTKIDYRYHSFYEIVDDNVDCPRELSNELMNMFEYQTRDSMEGQDRISYGLTVDGVRLPHTCDTYSTSEDIEIKNLDKLSAALKERELEIRNSAEFKWLMQYYLTAEFKFGITYTWN